MILILMSNDYIRYKALITAKEPWLLWIGADAAIVDFGSDVLRQLLQATDSHVQAGPVEDMR